MKMNAETTRPQEQGNTEDLPDLDGEWEMKRLGDIASFFKGSGLSKADLSPDGKRRCILYGELFTTYGERITEVLHGTNREGAFFYSLQNDVLMPTSDVTPNGLATASCIPFSGVILGSDILVIRAPEHLINGEFLAYTIKVHRNQVMRLVSGTTVFHLYGRDMANFRFYAPSVKEQRAIAEVLSDVDGLIQSLDALIAKKRAIKQATMQQLLTGKTRLPGFSGEWETKRLGDIGEISGAGVDKKIRPNEIMVRLVNYLDVYRKAFLYSKDLVQEVSAKQDQVRRCSVNKGDIFFTPTSEVRDDIGRSAVAMENISDGVYSYHVVRLRLNTNWDLRFRAYAFDTKDFYDQASLSCEGSGTRYVITLPKFRAITIRFPPTTEEQSAIATILSDMDAEIAALERRRDKTCAIKQGMMQQLLTGRIRLVKSK